jgi:hypothetical protein
VSLPPALETHLLIKCVVPPPGADPIGCNDLGDMWPKLWGARQ